MASFELVLLRSPVSQQVRRRDRVRRWRDEVRTEAEGRLASGVGLVGHLSLTILCVIGDDDVDVDNIAKPILDGLKGVVFRDDEQVVDCHLHKRYLDGVDLVTSLPILDDMLLRRRALTYIRLTTVDVREPLVIR